MYDLSDDRNCKETGIFAGAFAAGSFLCYDRIWNQYCMRKGITAPVNLNILSIGTGALLGLPGIIALYAAAVFLLQ
mgnify:CR=1 FL=1